MSSGKVTTIYIVRHAESENNINQIVGADPHLTENGKRQAKLLADKLSNIKFDYVFTSKLKRAKETAKIIIQNKQIPLVSSKAINERDYGIYEGKPIEMYETDLTLVQAKMRDLTDEEVFTFRRYESCETDKEMMERFIAFLEEITYKYKHKTLLVVTHGILMRVLLVYLKYSTYKKLPTYAIKNTGYIKIEFNGSEHLIKELNI